MDTMIQKILLAFITVLGLFTLVTGKEVEFSAGDFRDVSDLTVSSVNLEGIFLFEHKDIISPGKGSLNKIKATFVSMNFIHFQVWHLVSASSKSKVTYNLTAEKIYYPSILGPNTIHLTDSEKVSLKPGDQFAIYIPQSQCPVATKFEPAGITTNNRTLLVHTLRPSSMPKIGDQLDFDLTVPRPRGFDIVFYYETDIIDEYPPTPAPPVGEPIEIVPVVPPNIGNSLYVGNQLGNFTSPGTLTNGAVGTFILYKQKLKEGIVKTFYALVMRDEPIRFQIWRPTISSNEYQLVGEYRVIPDIRYLGRAQPFHLPPDKEIETEFGDVLGFTNEEPACSIAYAMNMKNPPYSGDIGDDLPEIGSVIKVHGIELPYYFAVGARYEIDPDAVPPSTLPPTSLPPSTTTTPSLTTKISTTEQPVYKPTEGENRLSQGFSPTSKYLPEGQASKTFVLSSIQFPEDGEATSFAGFFANKGTVRFQIWRHADESKSDSLVFVDEVEFTANQEMDFDGIRLDTSDSIPFKKGDLLGFVNEGSIGSIGYHFASGTSNPIYTSSVNASSVAGKQTFTMMYLPYLFAIAVTYKPLSDSTTTKTISTMIPPYTTKSSQRSTSPSLPEDGDKSTTPWDAIKTTVRDPNALPDEDDDSDWIDELDEPYIILGLLIWAFLVTIILLVCCCCLICKWQRDKKNPYKYYSYRSSGVPSVIGGEMKEEDLLAFYNSAGTIRPNSNQTTQENNNTISNLAYSNNLYSEVEDYKTKL